MLPRDYDIRNLALYAPRIAYGMIVGVPRVPFMGDLHLQFTSSAVNAPPIVQSFTNNVTQDTIIERVAFSGYQQNSFAGNPQQSLYFSQLKYATGIGVQVSVFGGPKYVLNDGFTPVENFADILAVTWPNGWPLLKQSNVKLQGVLLQTPTSVPYDLYVTFLGWQFLEKSMDDMSDAEARCRLKKMGIDVPDLATLLTP